MTVDHLSQSTTPFNRVEDNCLPLLGPSTPRVTLLADDQNSSEAERSDNIPGSDRKILRYILRGEYGMVGDPSAAADKENDEELGQEDGGKLAARFHDGMDKLESFGLAESVHTPDRVGRIRSTLVFLPHQAATTLTMVFNGNQPMLAFPTALLTRFETHILLTRDPKRCFGLAGLPGLGADYDECVSNLQKFFEHLGVEKVFCVGISAGGASAIKFGIDLKAHGILCFSAPTTLNLDDDPGAELSHYPQLTQLYRTDRRLGIDLAEYYRRAARRPGLLMVFGADHPRDSWLAERVGDVGGVELVEVKGLSGHKTYPWVIQHGFMSTLLERMFRLSPVGVPN